MATAIDSRPQSSFTPEQLSHHGSAVAQMIRINISFIVVTFLIIALRLFVRLRIVKHVGLDDGLMIGAGVMACAFSTMVIVGTTFGLGRHVWDLAPSTVLVNTKKVIQTLWICQVMYSTALTLVKLSIISSYQRIFPTRLFNRVMYTIGVFLIAVWICSVLATIFQCNPIRGAWDFTIHAKCISVMKYYYFSTAFSILTDLLLCLLPLPLLWKLKLPAREKAIVSFLFMLGLFATVASIIRITQLHNIQSLDITTGSVPTLDWSVVEVGTGIICACVPCLKPLFKRVLPGNPSTIRSHSCSVPAPSTPDARAFALNDCEMLDVDGPSRNVEGENMTPLSKDASTVTTRQFV